MFKLIFGLAFVSIVLGKEYPGFVKSFGSEQEYFISKDKLTFGQAQAACKVNGWSLALERIPGDTKILERALVKSKRAEKDYWLGAYLFDNDSAPIWIWLDLGEVMEYNNWVAEEPIDSRHCLVKTTERKISGKWKAVQCLEEHHYICLVK